MLGHFTRRIESEHSLSLLGNHGSSSATKLLPLAYDDLTFADKYSVDRASPKRKLGKAKVAGLPKGCTHSERDIHLLESLT